MGWNRWLVRAVPPALIAVAVILGRVGIPASGVVRGASAAARDCPATLASSARQPALEATVELRAKLSSRGELTGRTLVTSVGAAGQRATELAAESFAAPIQSNVVVFGQHEPGRGSWVRALDLQNGCEYALHSSADAVRSAVIDASLGYLFVHSVASGTRTDRGVRRIELGGGGSRVVAFAPDADDRFGTTYATRLGWSLSGTELAVQSCGIVACRTRVVDTAGALRASFDSAHGPLVGFTSTRLFAFDACEGLPCALSAIDRSNSAVTSLDTYAFSARLTGTDSAPVIAADTPAGPKEIRP